MGFVIDWKKKLGYSKDPFQELKVKPQQLQVSREKEQEKLNLFVIKQQKLALVLGEKGLGKSLLLSWLSEELKGSFKIMFLDNQKIISSSSLLFTKLLEGFTGVIDRVVKKSAEMTQEQKLKLLETKLQKKAILIIDDADKLSSKNQELLSYLLENTNIQLVLAVTKNDNINLKPNLELELAPLKEDNFEELLGRRIAIAGGQEIFPFKDQNLKILTKNSKGNPEKFLSLAREEAIELSLKVGKPPKPEQGVKIKKDYKQQVAKPKSSWFTIRFAKDKQEKELFILKTDEKDDSIDVVQATTSKTSKKTQNSLVKKKDDEDDSSEKAEEIHDFLQSLADEVDK